ncbi:MAG: nicotinamide riboside transporter PnuC [Bacteroidia bacterium]
MEDYFISFFHSVNIPESIAVLLSIAYAILAAKENIIAWYCAFISVLIYIYLCINAQLYAETFLQVFYLIMAVVGWYKWKFNNSEDKSGKKIIQLPLKKHLTNILLSSITTTIVGYILSKYTQAALPYMDAFTTVFSLYATWMVAQKVLENWLYWIVIDLVSFFLYTLRDLYLTGLLYIVFTILATYGYISWKKKFKLQNA